MTRGMVKNSDVGMKKCYEEETSSPASTYVPTPEGCSIISAEGLDFQVRDGSGYNPLAVDTGQRGTRQPWLAWLSLPVGLEGLVLFSSLV